MPLNLIYNQKIPLSILLLKVRFVVSKESVAKENCWGIISEIRGNECFVSTWDSEYILPFDNLEAIPTDDNQREAFFSLGERMTALFETGELDAAAMWVLKGLERLERSTLNSLEERLLQVLEDELL